MSEISTQLPNPPELQPISSTRGKIWQSLSYILMASGITLLAWGGWVYYQNQVEASKPPPARILEVSVADLETPSPQPSPTKVEPTTPAKSTGSDTLALELSAPPTPEPTAVGPEIEATLEAESLSQAESASVIQTGLQEETIRSQENTLTVEPTTETVLSLEDNPLVVAQEETASSAEVEPASNEVVPVVASPLTRMVAESINLDSPVVEVGWKQVIQNGQTTNVWVVAEFAAGWHQNSMLPGQGGNIVLSGHHNIKGEVFRHIVDLEPGAVISLYMDEQRFDYAVADKFIVKDKGEPEEVRRANAKWIGPFNEERLTLVTCWPYNNNTHRVIVIAKPV